MRYTILFIAILVVVSGFIAYFGDFIGRKMGKKRLTLFGMRPRHTAIVVTTITGMVIAVLTLVTVTGISTSIREVLVAGEQKIAENKELLGKNKRLLGTNKQLQEQEQTVRRSFHKAQQELADAQAARDDAVAKVDNLTNEITANLKQLNDLKSKKMLTQKQLEEKVRKLEELANKLQTMQDVLADKKRELALVQEQRDNFEAYNKKQVGIIDNQRATIESQQKAIDMQQDQLRDQYAKLVEMGKANLDLQDDVKNLQFRFMGGDIVLKQGQELTRRVVSQNQSVLGIKNEILAALSEASDKASKMGASPGTNHRAVVVIAPSAEDKCVTAAADAISKSAAPVLVQVLCITNTFKDEQAHVQFKLFPNTLAFSRGKTLASATIDGRQAEGKILLSVIGFLRANVRKAADAAGVVPVASPDPEITGDQLDELMDLVTKIKELNARVRLRASAEKDIYAAGPLDLKTIEFSISTVTAKVSEGR